jgi:hypothetical protein
MRAIYWPTKKAIAVVPYRGSIEAKDGRKALIGRDNGDAEVDHSTVLLLDPRFAKSPYLVLTIGHA